jgi:ADP-heptose:LPS heptosyltransferase
MPNKKQNVLINFRAGLGDFLMFTPVLISLRKNGYRIIMIVPSELEAFITATNYCDQTIIQEFNALWIKKIISLVKLYQVFRRILIDITIVPVSSKGFYVDCVTLISGAKKRIGFWHNIFFGLYANKLKIDYGKGEINNNLKILESLGIKPEIVFPQIKLAGRNYEKAEFFLNSSKFEKTTPLIAVAPLTKGMPNATSRLWPLERYVHLMEMLISRLGVSIILFGSPSEVSWLEKNISVLKYKNNVTFLPSDFEILDSAALLKYCKLLICNDGGLMHLAMSLGIDTVSIWGPTSPERMGYSENKNFFTIRSNICKPCQTYQIREKKCNEKKCLLAINEEEVFLLAQKIIQNENFINK